MKTRIHHCLCQTGWHKHGKAAVNSDLQLSVTTYAPLLIRR